ncbi:hypothetical protein [Pollutibacter soli]|uniref:hypothetical protein n=1 Tax=Pollutibacter soli TaxID=3034157 RepID=UPI003013D1A7
MNSSYFLRKNRQTYIGGSGGVYPYIYFDPAKSALATAFCNLPVDHFGKLRDMVHKSLEKIK